MLQRLAGLIETISAAVVTPSCVYMIQVIISERRGIKQAGLDVFRDMLGLDGAKHRSWTYVFVTPSDDVGAKLVSRRPCQSALKTFGDKFGSSVQLGFATVSPTEARVSGAESDQAKQVGLRLLGHVSVAGMIC